MNLCHASMKWFRSVGRFSATVLIGWYMIVPPVVRTVRRHLLRTQSKSRNIGRKGLLPISWCTILSGLR